MPLVEQGSEGGSIKVVQAAYSTLDGGYVPKQASAFTLPRVDTDTTLTTFNNQLFAIWRVIIIANAAQQLRLFSHRPLCSRLTHFVGKLCSRWHQILDAGAIGLTDDFQQFFSASQMGDVLFSYEWLSPWPNTDTYRSRLIKMLSSPWFFWVSHTFSFLLYVNHYHKITSILWNNVKAMLTTEGLGLPLLHTFSRLCRFGWAPIRPCVQPFNCNWSQELE